MFMLKSEYLGKSLVVEFQQLKRSQSLTSSN